MAEVFKRPEENTAFPWYVRSGTKLLRCGYTTGTCAALAAAGAAELLLTGKKPESVRLITPKGIPVDVVPDLCEQNGDSAVCAVRKDGGDDPDSTNGLLITAAVKKAESGIRIEGGEGVGRVTRPGLDQPAGEAAINSVPRKMIAAAVSAVCEECGYPGGIEITISVPGGAETAKKTFNPQLGITGGISILGTSGIVELMSEQALLDTIAVEIRQAACGQKERLILTPGNYGADYLRSSAGLPGLVPQVKCSNYIGDAVDMAANAGFREVLLVGHIGKLVKLAGGIMNTHSRNADGRREMFCTHAALNGATAEICRELMEQATTDGCIAILDNHGLWEAVLKSLLASVQEHLELRAGGALRIGALLFSNVYGTLGATDEAERMMEDWRRAGVLPVPGETDDMHHSDADPGSSVVREKAARPKIVIFGGTAEGRELSGRLAEEGADVIVCVASEYGSAVQEHREGITVRAGALTPEEKQELLQNAVLCVDATHPYAQHITESVREACEQAQVRRIRLVREASDTEGAVVVRDAAGAAEWLRDKTGNILLTTGVKELQAFRQIDRERLFPRILPLKSGLEVCGDMGIPAKNIIAMQGPFTEECNEAMIRQLHIDYLVSKDGGTRGGFPEKAEAAKHTGVRLIVIGREEEEGLSLQETLEACRNIIGQKNEPEEKALS